MTVRIVTWNVNGIRNPFKYSPWNKERTLQSMFDLLEADIVCFQEVKTPKGNLTDDLVFVNGWDSFYSFPHSQTGYSGVAVYTRDSKCIPLRVEEGVTGVLKVPGAKIRYVDLPADKQIGGYPTDRQLHRAAVGRDVIDSEGRCLVLEFPLFVLINVYCPAQRNHERTGYRNTFLIALDARIRNLAAAGKNIILLGDLNIMRDQLDTAGIWGHQGQKVLTEAMEFDESYMRLRAPKLLNQLMFNSRQISDTGAPFIDETVEKRRPPVLYDTTRERHPDRTSMFTCWDTRKNHRPANFGSRIDYIGCSPKIMQLVQDADIQPQLHGSDHCPVYIVLCDTINDPNSEKVTHMIDYLNPPGRYVDGKRALTDDMDDALLKRFPQSGRRMPHFTNRRHIGSMFRQSTKPAAVQEESPSQNGQNNSDNLSVTKEIAELPTIFRAEAVELVESSDNGSDSIEDIENDDTDSLRMIDDNTADEDSESVQVAVIPKSTKGKGKFSSQLLFPKAPERERGPPPIPDHKPPVAGSEELIDLPFQETSMEETGPDDIAPMLDPSKADGDHAHRESSNSLVWPLSMPKSKPSAAKRSPIRSRSGAKNGASSSIIPAPTLSSTASSRRPTKIAKTTSGFQTSMNMFLKARDDKKDSSLQNSGLKKKDDSQEDSREPSTSKDTNARLPSPTPAAAARGPARETTDPPEEDTWMTAEEADAAFKNLDAAKASWSKLGLGQRQVPMCEHGEPCKTFVTKKPGVNSGRSFYMCARPPGPLGKREKGTPWQCTTFVWCRDWKSDQN